MQKSGIYDLKNIDRSIREAMKTVQLPLLLPHLPEEIIANILSRLPVKHLTQLKCVCKPWLSLISDPKFAKLQLARSKKNNIFACHRLLLVTDPPESIPCEASMSDFDDIESKLSTKLEFPIEMNILPDSDMDSWPELGGSCDGLICAVLDHERIFVWNPTTREAKELTKPPAFDPKGTFSYGLGYDFLADDYKVVRAARASASNASSNETQFQVLSLKSNVWRSVDRRGLQPGVQIEVDSQGIFLNGALHWLVWRRIGPKTVYSIIAFNMVQEKFNELVRVPDDHREDIGSCRLGISGDCLCLFLGCGFQIDFEAFLLKEYGVESSWTRLFRVERDFNIFNGHKHWEHPLCYTATGKVVIDYDGDELVWYDPKDQTCRSFIPSNWEFFVAAVVYIQSLVSPHSYGIASSTNS